MPSDKAILSAKRTKQYYPYRLVWIAELNGKEEIICKTTRHTINKLIKQGWKVWEIK